MSKKTILSVLGLALGAVCIAGCGGIASIGTPTASEKEIPAEFAMGQTEGKIVVFASQSAWLKSPMDLRAELTKSFEQAFEERVRLKKERLIPYSDIVKLRMELAENERNDAFKIASKLNAAYVLTVEVMDFELSTFAERDFFNGMIQTKSCLYDIKGDKLWPEDEGRVLTLGFEAEKGTAKSAVEKLSNATAHCVTRYFYNCKQERFRIAEEQKEFDYYKW
ncbi:MAG: hypothetical protein A2173_02300 [Planctomycetes bacterium RBG_13_44_8b]|nr:MAG: hypothetical protein A2173_02300 [Planctomycetes bacterium RBG_13_44_8b]